VVYVVTREDAGDRGLTPRGPATASSFAESEGKVGVW
jgi:hypothetical protein